MPVKCDDKGNIYFRGSTTERSSKEATRTVKKLDREGNVKATFKLDSVPEGGKLSAGEFALDSQGNVYFLTNDSDRLYLVKFNRDGNYESKTKLSEVFSVGPFAVFGSGDFLISGVELPSKEDPRGARPITGIFDSSGKLVRKVALPDDEKVRASAEAGEGEDRTAAYGNLAVSLGVALPSEEGNVYLLRRSTPAIVYLLSPKGEVVRKFAVSATDSQSSADDTNENQPGGSDSSRRISTLLPQAMQLSQSELVLLFSDEDQNQLLLRVVNAQTGEAIATYAGTPELGSVFGCISRPPPTSNTLVEVVFDSPAGVNCVLLL